MLCCCAAVLLSCAVLCIFFASQILPIFREKDLRLHFRSYLTVIKRVRQDSGNACFQDNGSKLHQVELQLTQLSQPV
ncbi:hypothetical protein CANARDRAFT_29966 [[Candida] arabinofermentans NRRL YB-2248]|uniref:Uncharacterized protein n=1 Tax=[Candida] arabinofermentans NRRL YB-2248 TaxID=983967 RepID=A0A1E4SVJ4_9ASCO|nr:hypothetical protein CANARDRAFT_29966 [[Candida] arabinofermentans NRRL YB-2248]